MRNFLFLSKFTLLSLILFHVTYMDCEQLEKSNNITYTNISINNVNNCNTTNCPVSQGICYNDKCLCSPGYINYGDSSDVYCNYDQREHNTAFLLEFFFPFGIGHIYARNYFLGFYKILTIITTISFYYGMKCKGDCIFSKYFSKYSIDNTQRRKSNFVKYCKIHKHQNAQRLEYVGSILLKVLFAWIAFDIVMYALNFYTDGNGQDLL